MNKIFPLVFFFLTLVFYYSCTDENAGMGDEVTICPNGNWCINGIDTQVPTQVQAGGAGFVLSICGEYWCIDGKPTNAKVNDKNCSLTPDVSTAKVTITCAGESTSVGNSTTSTANSCTISETVLSVLVTCGEQKMEWLKDPALDPTADAEMLGIVPGATINELKLTWWSTKAGKECSALKPLVRLISDDDVKIIPSTSITTGQVNFGNLASKDRINSSDVKCYHQTTLTGLTPSKKYTYSVSADGETVGTGSEEREWNRKWSREYGYTAPSGGNAFKFAAVGDPQLTANNTGVNYGLQDPYSKYKNQTTANGWKETVKKIAEEGAQLIVSVGDQVDKEDYSENEYQNFFAPTELHSIPLAPTIGNHDRHCIYYSHYNMPNLQSAPSVSDLSRCNPTSNTDPQITGVGKGNYFYLYNNILFVVLNTAPYPASKTEAQSLVDAYDAVIKKAKTAYNGYDWLVVHHHKSTKSLANHASDIDIFYYVQAGLEKIMTDNGVDLVLSGHDHIYVRSHIMKWDASAELKCASAAGSIVPCSSEKPKGYSVRSADGVGTLYLTLTTASGLKYYPLYAGLACTAQNCTYSEDIPVLLDGTAGRTQLRLNYGGMPAANIVLEANQINSEKLPLAMSLVDQKLVPSYTMFEVNGKSMRVTTRGIDGSFVDAFNITKSGSALSVK